MVKNEQTGEIQAALYSSELGGILVALANSIQLDKRMEVLSRGVLGATDTELYAATKDHGNVTIVLSNNDTSSRTFELHQVSDGGSSSDSNLIGAKGASIAVGAYWGVRGIPLPSGESMRGLCSSASAVSYTVWGTPGGSSIPNIEIFEGPVGVASGDVVGPGSSTDNAVARFDSTTGKIIQDSGLIVNDAVELSGLTKMTLSNTTLTGSDEFGVETGSILKFYDGSAKRRVVLHTDAAPTDTQILVSNGTILQAKTVSGDATLANTGALTIAATAVEGSMLNDNAVSGQTELTGRPAETDEILLSDGGVLKRQDVDDFKLQPCARVSTPVNDDDGLTALDNGAVEIIRWTTEDFDNDTMFSAPDAEIIVPIAGKYLITANLQFNGHATGKRILYIYINDVSETNVNDKSSSVDDHRATISALVDLSANDNVEIRAYQDSGGALTVTAGEFGVARISP